MSLVLVFVVGVIVLGAAIVLVVLLLSPEEGRQRLRLGNPGVQSRRLIERRQQRRTFRRKATRPSRRLTPIMPAQQTPTPAPRRVITVRPATTPANNGFSMRNRRREVNLEALCRRTGKRRRVCGCDRCSKERAKLAT